MCEIELIIHWSLQFTAIDYKPFSTSLYECAFVMITMGHGKPARRQGHGKVDYGNEAISPLGKSSR